MWQPSGDPNPRPDTVEDGSAAGQAPGYMMSVAASLKFEPRGSGRPSCPRWIEA